MRVRVRPDRRYRRDYRTLCRAYSAVLGCKLGAGAIARAARTGGYRLYFTAPGPAMWTHHLRTLCTFLCRFSRIVGNCIIVDKAYMMFL